ncbi:cation:proton antiporter [Caldivirga maquilingensis]|uniref:Sodium/hydrogen exchanger n=1 Tax=Caldivirga maquilingensis (strain ATCC 700844 / DSM 13496 / JCM 10307 / IC-167) TaxID=397948 RepID=A8MAE8_CALMQ|nr:cation:proton antiporter [Caldivirga maquilingensis]ABW02525.1 sodium/hydrogen exchanger [Caldivirga maquilingensis IC-167]
MISTDGILITLALIILIGYVGDYLFRLTRVPEAVILMLIGILLVPIGHIIPIKYVTLLRELAPLFGDIALVMIMFDGGRKISFRTPLSSSGLGLTLATLDVVIPSALLAVIMYSFFNWPLVYGAILGAILGETTTTVIVPLATRLVISDSVYNMIVIEATFNSVVSILLFYLLTILLTGQFSILSYTRYVISYFSIAVFLGLVMGMLWLLALNWVKSTKAYAVTIGIAFLLYGVVDLLGGAAVVAVLIFAIIIGNHEVISEYMGLRLNIDEDRLNVVEDELEFLVRTFFYVLIGMISIISLYYALLALVITGLLLAIRYIEIFSIIKDSKTSTLLFALAPRGLTAAVLASIFLNMNYQPYSTHVFLVTFMVIIFTNIVSSGLLSIMVKTKVKSEEQKVK